MYETHSAGAIVLSLLLILSTGLAGVAVAADDPGSITPLQSGGGEITVVDDDNSTDGPEDQQPSDSFVVTNFEAPERVAVGEAVSVTATISNPNAFETNQSVEFRLDGDVVARQPFELDGEAEQTVTFELDTEELGVGTYIHGFLTTDRGGLAALEVIPFAELAIEEQESDGDEVVVDGATLSDGGFVAIYDEDGSFLGVSAPLDAGEHEDIEIELFEDDRIEFDRDSLDEENTLTAVAHLNTTDNETFDFVVNESLDRPYVDVGGEPITDNATVTVPAEDEESAEEEEIEEAEPEEVEEAEAEEEDEAETEADEEVEEDEAEEADEAETEESEEDAEREQEEADEAETDETDAETDTDEITPIVDFSDQESNGESVIVDNATLPVDGYVAISEDDEIIGVSEYLEAGEHTDIPIELFDVRSASFDREQLTESTTLAATLHEENSGNEKFDHVRNDIRDGPLVDDEGTSISEMAEITVPESVAEDPEAAEDTGDDADESAVDEVDADDSGVDEVEDTEVNEANDEGESNDESDGSADDETDSSNETSEEDDSTEPVGDENDEADDSDNEINDGNSEESEQEANESESGDDGAEEITEESDESDDEESDSSADSDTGNGVDDATESADNDNVDDGDGSEESEQAEDESEDGDEDVGESDDESDGESGDESDSESDGTDESDDESDGADDADESDDESDGNEESDADEKDANDESEDENEQESDDGDDADEDTEDDTDDDGEDDEEADDSE